MNGNAVRVVLWGGDCRISDMGFQQQAYNNGGIQFRKGFSGEMSGHFSAEDVYRLQSGPGTAKQQRYKS